MTQINFPFPSLSKDDQRKRALFKVYSLLLRLAEEKEKSKATPKTIKRKKEPSVPLQKNIPS